MRVTSTRYALVNLKKDAYFALRYHIILFLILEHIYSVIVYMKTYLLYNFKNGKMI